MKDLALLHPWIRNKANELIALCKQNGITIVITQTWRTKAEQDALYAQGRTSTGNIVTNAKYPQSIHCWGRAFDFVPLVNGKVDWNNISLFDKVGKLGESIGLEWGGNWKFVDRPHLQMPNSDWRTLLSTYKTPEAYAKTWENAIETEEEEMEKIKVVINGKVVEGLLDKDGKSYLPTRAVMENLKEPPEISWNGTTKTVTING